MIEETMLVVVFTAAHKRDYTLVGDGRRHLLSTSSLPVLDAVRSHLYRTNFGMRVTDIVGQLPMVSRVDKDRPDLAVFGYSLIVGTHQSINELDPYAVLGLDELVRGAFRQAAADEKLPVGPWWPERLFSDALLRPQIMSYESRGARR